MDITTFDNYLAYVTAITQPNSLAWLSVKDSGITTDQFAAIHLSKLMQKEIDVVSIQAASAQIRRQSDASIAAIQSKIAPSKVQ